MQLEDISRVAVIGAGTMGPGMGLCFALAGYDVMLEDIAPEQLKKAIRRIDHIQGVMVGEDIVPRSLAEAARNRISTTLDLEEALDGVQFMLEAVPENLDVKLALYEKIDKLCPTETILATNTSGLSVTAIAAAGRRPERVAGMHWVNPPELVPLVEVIQGDRTDEDTAALIYALAEKIGKMPIRVRKEAPGFAMNRLQFAALREAMHLVETGVVAPEDVDKAMSCGLGFRYPWLGPLRTADLGGLDVFHSVSSYLFKDLSCMDAPPESFNRMISEGKLGIKSGKGFYDYGKDDQEDILKKRDLYFIRQWKLIRSIQEAE